MWKHLAYDLRRPRKSLILREARGHLRAGQDHDEVVHPAYLLPTPRQSLSSEHNI